MFEELFRRFPDIEQAGPPARLRSTSSGGIKHLPVRFTPEVYPPRSPCVDGPRPAPGPLQLRGNPSDRQSSKRLSATARSSRSVMPEAETMVSTPFA